MSVNLHPESIALAGDLARKYDVFSPAVALVIARMITLDDGSAEAAETLLRSCTFGNSSDLALRIQYPTAQAQE